MDKITFRKATAEDKDAILSIHSNVFEGRDYLPAYFDHFLTCPGSVAAVVMHDGKVVSMISMISFEDIFPCLLSVMS